MIEYNPCFNEIKEAKKKAIEMGELRNSIQKGKGNAYGILGEIVVARLINAEIVNTYDYDLIKGRFTIDVKTKRCTSIPRDNYRCSIAAFNINQKCDYYIFVRILEDYSKVWVLGKKLKSAYFKEACFNRKDEIDDESEFGWKFKADCYNLFIRELDEIKL